MATMAKRRSVVDEHNEQVDARKHAAKTYAYMDDAGHVQHGIGCKCGFLRVDITEEEAERLVEEHKKPSFIEAEKTRKAAEPEILYTSKDDEVHVVMTDAEAHVVLCKEITRRDNLNPPRPSEFLESLVDQFGRGRKWSDAQRAWVHLMANQAVERAANAPPPPKRSEQTFSTLLGMLQHAADHLKFPRIQAMFPEGAIRINLAGDRSKYPGTLQVTSEGTFDTRTWYGRIHLDGRFEPAKTCPEWVVGALVEFDRDPAAMAKLQGTKYGHCCFCGLELTTTESVTAGYGPICADHYGLPWG